MNILSLTYLGNIQYFSKLLSGEQCIIDIHENYLKQSYRTRCDIMSAAGVIPLTINTVKGSNWNKPTVAQTRIDYSKRWQHQHWLSIVSAYRNSPYFDFYEEDFAAFYQRRYDFLLDFNTELLHTLLRLLGSYTPVQFSQGYVTASSEDCDWRDTISPKPRLALPDTQFHPVSYYQVFSDYQPFAANLSAIDLLFCEGPGAKDIISQSGAK